MHPKRKKSLRSPAPATSAPRPATRARRTSAHASLFFSGKKKKRAFWALGLAFAAGAFAVMAIYVFTEFNLTMLRDWIDGLSLIAVLPLMALLPVVGFPVAVVYLVAGARLGPVWGGVAVAGATTVHLLLTYLIARSFLRGPLERFIEKRHFKLPQIPEDEHAAIALVAALAPGIPYFVRNYLLALAGVRLKILLWVCVPVYTLRSYVTILLGDLGADPTARRVMILVGVDVLKIVICGGVIWWLRQHHRKYHGHEAHGGDAGAQPTGAAK
jgi:uncharacterized membrane protein YdjX (TVP38/TMEM64 family)